MHALSTVESGASLRKRKGNLNVACEVRVRAVKHAALAVEILADRDGKNEAAGKRLGKVP
jgi:hypothetical protein